MDPHHVCLIELEEGKYKTWQCKLPFNLSFSPSQPIIVDLLDYIKDGPKAMDLSVIQHAVENNYPAQCLFWFPEVYSGEMAFGALKSALYQSAEQQGFNFVVGKKKNACYGVVYTFVCSKFQYYIQGETKHVFDDGNTDSNTPNLYAKGLKVNNVRCNRKIESRGSSGQSLVRKTKTSKSTEKKQRYPFGINIVYGKDGYYYLSSVCRQNSREHFYHIRKTIVFSKTTTMDDHVKKC